LGIVALYLFWGNPDANIITQVRIPRLALTLLTGISLAAIGSVYQLMLANPLAEPYILGISSGGAFGSILLGSLGMIMLMPLGGFAGAMLTMLLVWKLAQKKGNFDRSRLILAGVIVGMFFASAISLIMYLNKDDTVLILNILMGNLGRIFTIGEWQLFLSLGGVCILLLIYLYMQSKALDIMSSGDIYATSVGINIHALRRNIFIASSLLLGIVVSYAGIIGFIGLITPHIARMLFAGNQKQTFLISCIGGGVFLTAADLIAKHITVIELPVGVVTAAIGCPFFIWLLLRK
jgi:iron complex transport system permease protein